MMAEESVDLDALKGVTAESGVDILPMELDVRRDALAV
jgi:hypothetical protein